jgi:hypothetical protein
VSIIWQVSHAAVAYPNFATNRFRHISEIRTQDRQQCCTFRSSSVTRPTGWLVLLPKISAVFLGFSSWLWIRPRPLPYMAYPIDYRPITPPIDNTQDAILTTVMHVMYRVFRNVMAKFLDCFYVPFGAKVSNKLQFVWTLIKLRISLMQQWIIFFNSPF